MILEITKLRALKTRLLELYAEYNRYIPINVVTPLIQQIQGIVDKLSNDNKEQFIDFKQQNYNSYIKEKIYFERMVFKTMASDIDYYLNVFDEINQPQIQDFVISDRGIFFAGQYFDALLKISDIIKKADNEIILIDGYIDEKILRFFVSKKKNVEFKILTKKHSFTTDLKAFIDAYNKQNGKLELKISEDFHDRFLIIDRKNYYHFGASLKDAGNKGFMFSRIDEGFIQQNLISEFEKYWK